jgi:hypothetical protein
LPENISLLSVLAAHGLDLDSLNGNLYLCPFHADEHPSLKLNDPDSRDGWFFCFGCGATGDMIHWLSRRYEISKAAAYRRLRTEHGLGADECVSSPPQRGPVHIGGLRNFTDQELVVLCTSRDFSFEALKQQLCPLLLKYVPHYSRHSAYALCDPLRRVAVLRKTDGQPWTGGEKAKFAPGSKSGVPIGIHAIAGFQRVMLNEGGPDFLRLVSLVYDCSLSADILPLMMSTAKSMIEQSLLNCFANKRVRICAHNDQEGISAARQWQDQLEPAGAIVDIWVPPKIQLPDGSYTKDLDDIFWKLSPDIRGALREVYDLINLDIRLFPPKTLLCGSKQRAV